MKRKLLFLAVAVICLSIVAAGTVAYFTAEGRAHNVITTGGVSIRVDEKTLTDEEVEVDFPEGGISGVMPGGEVSKIVRVQNTGGAEAWIRVGVSVSITGADGTELPDEITVGGAAQPVVRVDYLTANGWLDGDDGYYYCSSAVAPQAYTNSLFETVTFNPNMGDEYQSCTVNIIVNAQAVQTANNPIPSGGDVSDVSGWPQA